jgi:hypothetical protein
MRKLQLTLEHSNNSDGMTEARPCKTNALVSQDSGEGFALLRSEMYHGIKSTLGRYV